MIEPLERRLLLADAARHGLLAEYFDNADLSGRSVRRLDRNINFNWSYQAPDSAINADTFSARWQGRFIAPKTQTFTFFTTTDDGVRLYLDGRLLINRWTAQRESQYTAAATLVRGQSYDLRLEYFDRTGGAVARLQFASRSISRQLIPTSRLFAQTPIVQDPPDEPAPTPAPEPAPTPAPVPASAAPLRVSGRGFVDAAGKPFFWTSDTAWHLFRRLSIQQADQYLQDRADKGFNVIQALIDLTPGFPNYYGQAPLISNDPARFNPAYFQTMDAMVDKAASLGLVMAIAPMSTGAFEDGAFSVAAAFNYGRFLGQRYRGKPVVWMMGMDTDPTLARNGPAVSRSLAAGIAAGAADGDPSTVLITFMAPFNASSAKWFQNENWLDFNYIQSGHHLRDTWKLIAQDRARTPIKPTLDGETTFEDIPDGLRPGASRLTDVEGRIMRYWAAFAGAAGVSYGHNDIWQFYSAGASPMLQARGDWRQALDAPGAQQIRFLRQIMESRGLGTQTPDQTFLLSDGGAGADHQQALRAGDSTWAMVYTPRGGAVRVDLSRLKARHVKASWFNPRTGQTTVAATVSTSSSQTFVPARSGYGQDWVLLLDRVD